MLGPFVAQVSEEHGAIWLQLPGASRVYVSLRDNKNNLVSVQPLVIDPGRCHTGMASFGDLRAQTIYRYDIFEDESMHRPLDLRGLSREDLYFHTFPGEDKEELPEERQTRLDFILMSCHNPMQGRCGDGDGYEMWRIIEQIIEQNKPHPIYFALLAGDQIYTDQWYEQLQRAGDEEKLAIYLKIYQLFWSHISYRRILCKLPALLIWDDHDIMDGWGSAPMFFDFPKRPSPTGDYGQLKDSARRLFQAAKTACRDMQAQRNPAPLLPETSFDFALKVQRTGFVMLDLRSFRNIYASQNKGRMWLPEQRQKVRAWIRERAAELDTVFVVTPVVMAHGAPRIDNLVLRYWSHLVGLSEVIHALLPAAVHRFLYGLSWEIYVFFILFGLLIGIGSLSWGAASVAIYLLSSVLILISSYIMYHVKSVAGDIRDDINDAWSAERNAHEAEAFLTDLYDLQNQNNLDVIVLSGDIHAAGYAGLYSAAPQHRKRPFIPHITASPVSNEPFHWLGEAIYRRYSKTVRLGNSGTYSAQISHHFTHRNLVLCSLRRGRKGHIIKIKYYLEGFEEPQIFVFDLRDSSHREGIVW